MVCACFDCLSSLKLRIPLTPVPILLRQGRHLPRNLHYINYSVSFFLTPLNYFDYDVSIDSSNAILLYPPEEADGLFTFDDYGVTPKNCFPNSVPEFEYSGMKTFGRNGNIRPISVEDMRREAEVPFRIKVEL